MTAVSPSQSSETPKRPAFVITIDTEGDNLWSRPRTITTQNAAHLPRFQSLCEKYRLRPTYLTNWEMARCPAYQEFARDVIARGVGEIGMHLHAWNNPPLVPLSDDDDRHHPFLIEYPVDQMRQKIAAVTDALEETLHVKMVSHRAGRFMLDEAYAQLLAESGYLVDCSVTPHVSLKGKRGAPGGKGGVDYSQFPEAAYFIDLRCIQRRGQSPLLEVPVTILPQRYPRVVERLRGYLKGNRLCKRILNRLFPQHVWLRPNGRNLRALLSIVSRARSEGRDYIEFLLHSSEFMPAGSPTFPSAQSIEVLYRHLETLFDAASRDYDGLTLQEYRHRLCSDTLTTARDARE